MAILFLVCECFVLFLLCPFVHIVEVCFTIFHVCWLFFCSKLPISFNYNSAICRSQSWCTMATIGVCLGFAPTCPLLFCFLFLFFYYFNFDCLMSLFSPVSISTLSLCLPNPCVFNFGLVIGLGLHFCLDCICICLDHITSILEWAIFMFHFLSGKFRFSWFCQLASFLHPVLFCGYWHWPAWFWFQDHDYLTGFESYLLLFSFKLVLYLGFGSTGMPLDALV